MTGGEVAGGVVPVDGVPYLSSLITRCGWPLIGGGVPLLQPTGQKMIDDGRGKKMSVSLDNSTAAISMLNI